MHHKDSLKYLCLFLGVMLIASCASTTSKDPKDPYESLNRKIYTFNDTFDKILTKPIAKGYNYIMPNPVKKGIGNFFRNIEHFPTIVNDVLQGEPGKAGTATTRLVLNSTLGLAGLIDVAEYMDIPYHRSDLGMTFARWGDTHSPYIVIPFLGPSTVRDTVAMFYDEGFGPLIYLKRSKVRDPLYALRLNDKRYQLLDADKVLEDALDPYIMQRDAYLQYRDNKIKGDSQSDAEKDTYVE